MNMPPVLPGHPDQPSCCTGASCTSPVNRARAVRWSSTHVMIKLQERDGLDPQYLWLRSGDVHRAIRRV